MEIEYCYDSILFPWQEELLYRQVGKYMCVGFADMNTGWPVPVWRKVDGR